MCVCVCVCVCVCSAQSKNRYNSGIVLHKVRILVPNNSRIAQEICIVIDKVNVPAQSGNSLDKVRIY